MPTRLFIYTMTNIAITIHYYLCQVRRGYRHRSPLVVRYIVVVAALALTADVVVVAPAALVVVAVGASAVVVAVVPVVDFHPAAYRLTSALHR